MMLVCKCCGYKEKPGKLFSRTRMLKSGKDWYCYTCRPYMMTGKVVTVTSPVTVLVK